MIIFLYGEDSYRSRQKLREIIEHYKNLKHPALAFSIFNFQDKKEGTFDFFSELKEKVNQFSMFQENKFLVLINSFSNKNFKEKFLKEAKNIINSKDVFLFYEDNKIDQRDLLFKFLKKEAKCQEFKLLEGQNLKNWVKKELNRISAKIEPKALERFFVFITNNLWQTSNEIKKLASFRKGKVISSQDIELMVKPKIETDIFKTIEAVSKKDKKYALNLLRKHIENGDSPLYLLSMINFQFRNLLIIKDLVEKRNSYDLIIEKSGLHPFVARKSYMIANNFSLPELKKIYQKIFETDYSIKTGKVEPETALDLFIAQI